jgi:hypothetical protein
LIVQHRSCTFREEVFEMPGLTGDIVNNSRFFCSQVSGGKRERRWLSCGREGKSVLEQRWTEVPSPDSVSVGEVNVRVYPSP